MEYLVCCYVNAISTCCRIVHFMDTEKIVDFNYEKLNVTDNEKISFICAERDVNLDILYLKVRYSANYLRIIGKKFVFATDNVFVGGQSYVLF